MEDDSPYSNKILDMDIAPGYVFPHSQENYCFNCGKRLGIVFDGSKLLVSASFDSGSLRFVPGGRCKYECVLPFVGNLETSGTLVFTNFFRCGDTPAGKEYTEKFDLNCVAGCRNIMKHKLSTYGIAYGQMGNMSVGVYVNDACDSIIIGDPWVYDRRVDSMTEEEFALCDKNSLSDIEGHKTVGSICLGVWRFEAGDKKNLGELYSELVARNSERIEVDCVPGTWGFTHFYDVTNECGPIYSRFKLINKERKNED